MSEAQGVAIDTSTLVGAVLRPESVPRQALLAAIGVYQLCFSDATLWQSYPVTLIC